MHASTLSSDRRAETDSPLLDVLVHRWSPRAYDATEAIDEAKLGSALEAARWSPSAGNTQPWRFIVARRGTPEHATVQANLVGFNKEWAGDAAVLIVAIAEHTNENGDAMTWAHYDLGQAMAHLSVQAHHDGLHVHQMGGFDGSALSDAFELDSRFAPVTVATLGTLGDPAQLPEVLQEREVAPRTRRALGDSVIVDA
ncbi:MAG TPA: nitroreductase family protein [Microbacteriaceae bacterium]|nr:nitroreductase family protein [Microbacteriaceae bacterium]HQX36617.1 nitroreductase family protein [Microbacteriaceae bacterium]HQZ46928.1 nitroreductase family protein [Microbacteriaceae bacterium]HRA08058.1 nitroreductase family protein [Microbacteriaceae bacterium]